jgi:hypothetical protein
MVAAVVAAGARAQTPEDLQKQLNELKASMQSQIQRLESENAALKAQTTPATDAGLETEINRLSERMAAGTNLRSCASQIKLGGEFRYRLQYADGDTEDDTIDGGQGPDADLTGFWTDARVRLNFQYDFGCDATAFAELQSHFAFGQDEDGPIDEWDGNDSVGNVGMYQAWLEFRNIFSRSELTARVGRQEVVLGNQFQFGNADWYNGVVHDGLRVDWRANCWSLTLLASKLTSTDGDFNQFPSYFDDHDDDELYSAYFTLKSIKNMAIDLYWIYINGHGGFAKNSGASFLVDGQFLYPETHAYYHTFGARIGGMFNVFCGLDYNLEGAIQTGTGTFGLGGDEDIDGATVEGELGLTLSKSNRFRIFARGLWAEGGDTDSAGYLINYPNRHSNTGFRARYGIADIIPMTNVFTLQAGLHFDPACNWTLGATGLWAESDNDDPITGDPTDYGTELDIWAEYRYTQNIALGAGFAIVWPDDDTGFGDSTFWTAYLQARLFF